MNDELSRLLAGIDAMRMNRRGFMARTAAFGAAAAMGGVVLATNPARAEEPKKGGTIKFGFGGGETTDSLDPALALNNVGFFVTRQWGDCIVGVTPDGQIRPILAESVTSNADASVWNFAIRQGVKFHDGTDMTAADVVATFKRHSDENSKSGAAGVMSGLKDITSEGNNVIITTTGGSADLPYLLSDYHLVIQPKGGVDNPTAMIGTGPYKVVSAKPGERYEFAKFAEDWDTTRGHYDGVELLVINDSTARNSALQAGQVHVVNKVDPKVAKLVASAPGTKLNSQAGRGHYVFIMQINAAPFDNKDLRLALKYSINRQEMVDKILEGFGAIGNDIPINASYPLFDETLEQRPFDVAKAAEHYKASGHDGSPIELIVAETAFTGSVDAATLWQATAAEAGIPLTIKVVPDDGYWSDVWNVKPFCAS